MKTFLLCMTAAVSFVALTSASQARSTYDGSWNLLFVTERGACDPSYNFSVNIIDGIVTHPNLVKFRGFVARSGAVRASVTVRETRAAQAIGKSVYPLRFKTQCFKVEPKAAMVA